MLSELSWTPLDSVYWVYWGLWRREHWIGNPCPAKGTVEGCSWFGMQLGSTQPPCLNNSDLGIEISAGDSRWLRWAHSKKMTFLKCWGQVMTALPHSSNLRWFKVFKGRTKACWAIFRSLASHWLSIRFTFKINPRCSQHTNGLSRSSLSRKIAPLRPTTSHLTESLWTSDGHLCTAPWTGENSTKCLSCEICKDHMFDPQPVLNSCRAPCSSPTFTMGSWTTTCYSTLWALYLKKC